MWFITKVSNSVVDKVSVGVGRVFAGGEGMLTIINPYRFMF